MIQYVYVIPAPAGLSRHGNRSFIFDRGKFILSLRGIARNCDDAVPVGKMLDSLRGTLPEIGSAGGAHR